MIIYNGIIIIMINGVSVNSYLNGIIINDQLAENGIFNEY